MWATLALLLALTACDGGDGKDGSAGQDTNNASNNGGANNASTNNGGVNNGGVNNGGVNNADPNNADPNNASTNNSTVEQGLTYHKDVRPMLEQRCLQCHNGGGIAPSVFDFRDPATVVTFADLIMGSIEDLSMPPWQANEGCSDYKDDLSLSADEIELVRGWIADGKQLGDEADYVAPQDLGTEIDNSAIERPADIFAVPTGTYTAKQGVSDDYRCFVFDPGFTDVRHVQGYEVKPDNKALLHHLIIYTVPPEAEADEELARLEAEDDAAGYECFGGARVPSNVAVAWAPGGGKTAFPANTGLRMEAGTKFVIQMHYNLSEGGDGLDRSGVDLWLYPEGQRPAKEGIMAFIGNMPFQVPAAVDGRQAQNCNTVYATAGRDGSTFAAQGIGEDELRQDPSLLNQLGDSGCVTQDFYYDIGIPVTAHAIAPHMHLSGTHISAEVMPLQKNDEGAWALPEQPQSTCMLKTDRWDFDWQRFYWFQEPQRLPPAGVVRLTCRYNNTYDHPIHLGENSRDEMCLILLYLTPP
jgi:hypothetical protein